MLNRCAIVVRKKQPFLDWLRVLPDPVEDWTTLATINREPHIYLLPEYAMGHEQEALLKRYHARIFDAELMGWWRRESDWPRRRNVRLFTDWFEVSFHSSITDLVAAPLVDED